MKTQRLKKKPTTNKSAVRVQPRIKRLEQEVAALRAQCARLQDPEVLLVPIETLAPEPFVLRRPFHVVVCPYDGEFMATFFDVGLSMSGDTPEEAVAHLKAVIVDTFDDFERNESRLGPGPARQLAVLREFIQNPA